jgi:putative ABC transport system substrate-binding protein
MSRDKNLMIERYSGEGRPEGYADLAREVVGRNPDLIVAQINPVALAVRAASGTIRSAIRNFAEDDACKVISGR